MINFSNASSIYVSQHSGSDANTGLSPTDDGLGGGPLKSIENALERVCQLRSAGILRPITIKLMDEEYYLDKTIDIDYNILTQKYNTHECFCSVAFEPYYERAAIVGGKRLCGFKRDTFNGKECFSLFIPEVKSGKWSFTDLYVDGKRAALTRYPKSGTLRCIDTEHSSGGLFTHSKWFTAKKEDLEEISSLDGAIVSYYHYWIDEHSPVESYDKSSGRLVMKYMSRFLISNQYAEENEENAQHNSANLEYYLENIPEMFKNANEWYLSRDGMLYYIPSDSSQTPENITVYAPTVDKILNVCGSQERRVKNIDFRDIDFICSKGDYASKAMDISEEAVEGGEYASDSQAVSDAYGAVNFKNSYGCRIEGCTFKNLGVQALSIDSGCSDIRVETCEFYDIGAGGVRIFGGEYGCAPEDETHHITVRGCKISKCGRRYAAACGILACHAHDCEISDNEISFLDYSGISVGWVWGYRESNTFNNVILRNHIHHIGMGNLSDMGGIYLLGRQRGTVVRENVIHDVICKHYGGWGIYTDEGSSYITVEKNIVYNCSSECFHQHYGCCNVVKNNVFAFGGNSVVRCSIDELHSSLSLENNVLVTRSKPVFSTADANKGFCSSVSSQGNIIYDADGADPCIFICGGRRFTLSDAQSLGLERGSIAADPLLCGDFRPADNSPVYSMGFKKI